METSLSVANMNHHPHVVLRTKRNRLPPSPRLTNSVIILIDINSGEIRHDPTTRQTTVIGSTPVYPPILISDIHLRSLSHNHILSFLRNKPELVNLQWLCEGLAGEISRAATDIGFGHNSFTLTTFVTITYQAVAVMFNPRETILRMVRRGRISPDEFKCSKLETESCSICLDNLFGPKRTTRMTCSHVFHEQCLLEWLTRKNTCPLCRTVLYDN